MSGLFDASHEVLDQGHNIHYSNEPEIHRMVYEPVGEENLTKPLEEKAITVCVIDCSNIGRGIQLGISKEGLRDIFDCYGVSPRFARFLSKIGTENGLNPKFQVIVGEEDGYEFWYHVERPKALGEGTKSEIMIVYHGNTKNGVNIICFTSDQRLAGDITRIPSATRVTSNPFLLHVMLLQQILDEWHETPWTVFFGIELRRIHRVEMSTAILTIETIRQIDDHVNNLGLFEVAAHEIHRVLNDLSKHHQHSFQLSTLDITIPDVYRRKIEVEAEIEYLMRYNLKIKEYWASWIRLLKQLRDRHRMQTEIANSGYIRTNMIEMRRIAQAAQRESEKMESIAQSARDETRQMATLAVVTMAYLPGSFVATLFGMDFLGLNDDNKTFKALDRIWIYFLIAVPLTSLTFGIWALWNRRRSLRESAILGELPSVTPENVNEETVDNSLEPQAPAPQPDVDTLIAELIDNLQKTRNTGQEDQTASSEGSAESTTSESDGDDSEVEAEG